MAGGKLANSENVPSELAEVLTKLGEREGVNFATLALAFVLAHPARPIPIIGTTNPDRIKQARAALGVNLDRADVYKIIQASMGEPLP